MSSMFSKPLQELSVEDALELVSEGVPESASVEFKERLPHKTGGKDSWYAGANSIGDYARDKVLEEVIAFANAHGGHIVLGIRESDDQPRRAAGLEPIPRCDELADRFRLVLRDCVDPQIPLIQVAGVRSSGDSGLVVIRVPESRMAPHRHKGTLHCYYRRSDRSEKMGMREIQDLTLSISRGLETIERTYEKRSADFRAWVKLSNAMGIRATVVALSPLRSSRVFRNPQLFPHVQNFALTIGKVIAPLAVPITAYSERPILRGAQRYWHNPKRFAMFQEVYSDGLVETRTALYESSDRELPVELILAAAANTLVIANTFRRTVGAPEIEYGLELEIFDPLSLVTIRAFPALFPSYGHTLANAIQTPCVFPRYSLGDENEIGSLIEIITRDIFDAAGTEAPSGPYALSWQ